MGLLGDQVNYTVDQLTSWADKLTYRLMVMIGVPDENLQAYLKAVVDRQNGVAEADQALQPPVTILGIQFKNIGSVIKTVLVIVILIILYRVFRKQR
jgi:hypothetical protein